MALFSGRMAMSIDRRATSQSRRRRVLYQFSRDFTPESPAERRAAEKLREARRPTASYGSHVNRRLRGRWFSLVPVRRRTIGYCGIAILGCTALLTVLHWAAVAWAPLAYNAELARPLRLDRPDSFGAWARTFFLAAASATSLLIYQLRRYKIDDYKGHYRIWRPIILLLAAMSVDSVCGIVPWVGAMIDAMFGQRIALTGADWFRIVLTVGGVALALRLVVEVRQSKLALGMMLVAIASFATPLFSRWGIFDGSTMTGWLAVTSAPLIASGTLWLSLGGYLRMLYREVRGLNEESLPQVQETSEQRKPAKKSDIVEEEPAEKPGWFARWKSNRKSELESAAEANPVRSPRVEKLPAEKKEIESNHEAKEPVEKKDSAAPERKSWFALRRKKKDDAVSKDDVVPTAMKPTVATAPIVKSEAAPAEEKVKRSWFSRKPVVPETDAAKPGVPKPATPTPAAAASSSSAARQNTADSDDDDDDPSDDSVDWGSMNKSERRRMRKEMKRSGRAA